MNWDWLDSPIFWASVGTGFFSCVAWIGDKFIAKRKEKSQGHLSERELLSKDGQEFRVAIIHELRECEEDGKRKDELIGKLQIEAINCARRISNLEFELDQLKIKMAAVAQAGVTAVAQAGAAAVGLVQQGATDILQAVAKPLETKP